jgi:hypothetical protein
MPKHLDTGEVMYFYYDKSYENGNDKARSKDVPFSKDSWDRLKRQWEIDYPVVRKDDTQRVETLNERSRLVASYREFLWDSATQFDEAPKLNGEPLFKLDPFGNVISR